MLELDDIQHFLLTRPPALAARYAFLTFQDPAQGRAWLGDRRLHLERAAGARRG